tara:strand:+ start:283 stop:861 length:579 start_codon:yes stop_codon:yes gene_type:complete
MFSILPLSVLLIVGTANHLMGIFVTQKTLAEHRPPLSDVIHDHMPIIDAIYVHIIFFIHFGSFIWYAFYDCQHLSNLYYRVSYFLSFMMSFRLVTTMVTSYPNARSCESASFGTYCGDMMFSGHALFMTTIYLAYHFYKGHDSLLWHAIHFAFTLTGLILLIITRMHYTNDVLISIYITTVTWKLSEYIWRF